jgi:hypothetical protein
MGLLTRLLGLSEDGPDAQARKGIARSDLPDGVRHPDSGPDADPLSLANVEAAMTARESAQGRAARRKIMEALDDEARSKELVGALRRIMREGDGS